MGTNVIALFIWMACAQIGGFSELLPPTGESLVSDARGFGAVKLLLDEKAAPFQEMRLGDDTLAKLRELRISSSKRFRETSKQITGGSVLLQREAVTNIIDPTIESQLEEILGKETFRDYSRFVVRQRTLDNCLMVFRGAGVFEYLKLNEKKRFDSFCEVLQSIDGGEMRFNLVKAELNWLVSKLDRENQSKCWVLFGDAVKLNSFPESVAAPPDGKPKLSSAGLRFAVSDEGFKQILHGDEVARRSLSEVLRGIEADRQEKLYPMLSDTTLSENMRKERAEALMMEFGDRCRVAALKSLNAKQLQALQQYMNQGKLNQQGFRVFFEQPEIAGYLHIGGKELADLADEANKNTNEKRRAAAKKELEQFLRQITPDTKERLNNLVDVASLDVLPIEHVQ